MFLVSHLIFDGEVSRTTCSYNNQNDALITRVRHLMRRVYQFEPKQYKNSLTGVTRISYYNVALGAYMQEKSKELLSIALTLPKELKRNMVKAFFDDEGCMDFRQTRNIRQVRGYQKNVAVLKIIQKLLLEFDIPAALRAPNEIVISRKSNLEKFQKEIGFSPGVYINGNRTNSTWKKHLEKRVLLDRAINSYVKT